MVGPPRLVTNIFKTGFIASSVIAAGPHLPANANIHPDALLKGNAPKEKTSSVAVLSSQQADSPSNLDILLGRRPGFDFTLSAHTRRAIANELWRTPHLIDRTNAAFQHALTNPAWRDVRYSTPQARVFHVNAAKALRDFQPNSNAQTNILKIGDSRLYPIVYDPTVDGLSESYCLPGQSTGILLSWTRDLVKAIRQNNNTDRFTTGNYSFLVQGGFNDFKKLFEDAAFAQQMIRVIETSGLNAALDNESVQDAIELSIRNKLGIAAELRTLSSNTDTIVFFPEVMPIRPIENQSNGNEINALTPSLAPLVNAMIEKHNELLRLNIEAASPNNRVIEVDSYFMDVNGNLASIYSDDAVHLSSTSLARYVEVLSTGGHLTLNNNPAPPSETNIELPPLIDPIPPPQNDIPPLILPLDEPPTAITPPPQAPNTDSPVVPFPVLSTTPPPPEGIETQPTIPPTSGNQEAPETNAQVIPSLPLLPLEGASRSLEIERTTPVTVNTQEETESPLTLPDVTITSPAPGATPIDLTSFTPPTFPIKNKGGLATQQAEQQEPAAAAN